MADKEEMVQEETEVKEEEMEVETEQTIDQEEKTEKKKKLFRSKDAEKVEELQKEVIDLTDKLAAMKNEYFKAYADTENMKKRLQAEFDSRNKYRIQDFAKEILPAIDNLERALIHCEPDSPIYVGVNMTLNQLVESLKKEGVTEMDCLNKPFDPNFHNAIMSEAREGVEKDTVIEVFQKGYMLKDRILRAALVKVSE